MCETEKNRAQYKTRSLLVWQTYSLLKQENGQNANYIVCAYNVMGKIFKIVEYDILLVAGCIRAEYTSPLTSSPSSLRWYRCSLPLSAERVRLHYLYTVGNDPNVYITHHHVLCYYANNLLQFRVARVTC